MMKEIVNENMLTNNQYSGAPGVSRVFPGLSNQADLTAGPTTNKAFAWRNVLKTIQSLQTDSKHQDNEVFFAIVPTSETTMQFRTYTGQPGQDRTKGNSNNPIVFSLHYGNMRDVSLEYDFSDEIAVGFGLGQGENDRRHIQSRTTGDRRLVSAYHRIEEAYNATNAPYQNNNAVVQIINEKLQRARPTKILTATLIDAAGSRYGKDWREGDRVTIDYQDIQEDTIIRAVRVQVRANGRETITARVELDI